MNSDWQEGDRSPFFQKLSPSKVHLYTPSSTYGKSIKPQNATIAVKIDFKVEVQHKKGMVTLG